MGSGGMGAVRGGGGAGVEVRVVFLVRAPAAFLRGEFSVPRLMSESLTPWTGDSLTRERLAHALSARARASLSDARARAHACASECERVACTGTDGCLVVEETSASRISATSVAPGVSCVGQTAESSLHDMDGPSIDVKGQV
jgi:hypothetical protein